MIHKISIKNFKGKLVYLFITLIIFLLTQIIFVNNNFISTLLVLLSAFYVTSYDKKHTIYDILFFGFFISSVILKNILHSELSEHIYSLITNIIFIYTSYIIIKYLVSNKKVTMDFIYGALSLYILVGIIFANIYSTINLLDPFLFNKNLNSSDLIYFSFVTITSTGYGDIVPISPYIKALAIFEALFGIFYVATFVARAISMYDDANINKTLNKKLGEIEHIIEEKN